MTESSEETTPLGTPSAAEALAQLHAAGAARVVSRRDRLLLVGYTAALGLLVATVLALAWWTLSAGNTAGFVASFSGYAAVLLLLIALQRRAQAAPRGFARLYRAGLLGTMTLYAVGVTWFTARQADPLPAGVFLPYCALVAVPCLVAAARVDRLARQ